MNVRWSITAKANLRAIHDYISENSAIYATQMVDRLTSRTIQIAQFPHSGRVVPELGNPSIREIIEGSYRIIYIVGEREINVAAVVHCARDFPKQF